MKKMKSTMSAILALCMVFALAVPAFADNIDESGESATVPITLTAEAATFSATVPTSLPVSVDCDGEVTCASNAKILNNSACSIKVASVEITGKNGWELVSYASDFSSEKAGAKKVGFELMGKAVSATGSADVSEIPAIDVDGELTLSYGANMPAQISNKNSEEIASAVITLAWNE